MNPVTNMDVGTGIDTDMDMDMDMDMEWNTGHLLRAEPKMVNVWY